jgi:transcriptional regulator with PAS, ATPase and Fis domain
VKICAASPVPLAATRRDGFFALSAAGQVRLPAPDGRASAPAVPTFRSKRRTIPARGGNALGYKIFGRVRLGTSLLGQCLPGNQMVENGKTPFPDAPATLEAESAPHDLVGRLLRMLLRDACAHRVCLLRCERTGIAAIAIASDRANPQFPENLSLEASNDLPHDVIRHVAQSGEGVILSGSASMQLAGDAYLARAQPKTIVCEPVLGRAAILYLESSADVGTFREGCLETIRILGTCAAGALDYGLMYESLRHRAEFLQAAIDALPAHIAILDQDGTIIAVNGAWRRFADENALAVPNYALQTNYLATCDRSATRSEQTARVVGGIRDVLAARKSAFFAEYDCHSSSEQRWFQMRVCPFREGGSLRLIIAHQPITEIKRTQFELQHALDELAQLKNQLEAENLYLQEEIKSSHDFEEIIGKSQQLHRVLHKVELVASTNSTVLITGETGTGKELLARAIHSRSPRKEHPLVKVNCAALPANLIESELFGHEKGAFTGALSQRIGRFELANHGTIFLDEIGDLPLDLQSKLLRVLQEGEFERLGSSKPIKVDVRMIAATNCDLEKAVKESKFRSDLFYRLNVFPIVVPSLRERETDIPLLVHHFIEKNRTKLGKNVTTVPKALMDTFIAYDWPGNVRELANIIERAMILSSGPVLTLDEPLRRIGATQKAAENSDKLEATERALILKVLNESGWKIKGKGNAAERLGLNPSTLRSRIQKLGIVRPARTSQQRKLC